MNFPPQGGRNACIPVSTAQSCFICNLTPSICNAYHQDGMKHFLGFGNPKLHLYLPVESWGVDPRHTDIPFPQFCGAFTKCGFIKPAGNFFLVESNSGSHRTVQKEFSGGNFVEDVLLPQNPSAEKQTPKTNMEAGSAMFTLKSRFSGEKLAKIPKCKIQMFRNFPHSKKNVSHPKTQKIWSKYDRNLHLPHR